LSKKWAEGERPPCFYEVSGERMESPWDCAEMHHQFDERMESPRDCVEMHHQFDERMESPRDCVEMHHH